MITKKLDPISISMIAPTGTGKTSLVKTIVQYIRENVSEQFELKTTNIEADELQELSFSGQANANFEDVYVGSSSCTQYDFSIIYNNQENNVSIEQPFSIMDYPGGYINQRDVVENSEIEFKTFYEHLSKSQVLWIPIDAPIMMSAVTKDEIECSKKLLSIDNVKKYVEDDWLGFIKANPIEDKYFCNFVLLKSESYFSQDKKRKYGYCKRQFDTNYEDIVKYVKDNSNNTRMACICVETYGSCEVKTVDWDIENNKCSVEYRATAKNPKVHGVQEILKDCMSLAVENINSEIQKLTLSMSDQTIVLEEQRQALINQSEERIKELSARLYELESAKNDKSNLDSDISYEENRNWFVYMFRGGVRENLYYRRSKINALIGQLESEKHKQEGVIAKLQNDANDKNRDKNDILKQIEGLKVVVDKFNQLSAKERNTDEYYRYL